ncbi:MAG: winged helix-turn-helix transcriptional regulator [Acidobacteria bacterium]|nr:winged helix-turn-helix transcriptional regulator [Acidobacteriota bacterium]
MQFHQTVNHLLSRVATAHRSRIEKRLGAIGIHSGQLTILFELWKNDGRRQVDLAAELRLAPPTINKTLIGMIDLGLVTRERLEDDARSTRIFLTDAGKQMRQVIEAEWLEIEEEMLTVLTETERLVLFDLLTKLKHFYFGTEPEE